MNILEKLCSINAVSANEADLAKVIENELKDYVDEIKTDCLGNVIAHKKGNKNKIMFSARMDETGGLVTYVHENGNARFNPVGECDVLQFLNMTAVFKDGKRGIICADEGKNISDIKASDMYVDMGHDMGNIGIGDVFSVYADSILTDSSVMTKGAGVRSGVYALICAMKEINDTANDIYAVFAARSGVGFKGAKTAAESIAPEMAFCIGEAAESKNIKCGSGVVFNLKGANSISDKTLLDMIRNIADENKIPYMCDVSKDGMSEGGIIKKSGEGVRTLEISIPVKYKEAPRQSVDKKDITAMTELLKHIAKADFI